MKIQRIVIAAERTCALETHEIPDRLERGQMLIASLASLVSSGTEMAIYKGIDPLTRKPGSWCAYPWRAGYANVGEIVEVGPEVPEAFRPGRTVFTFGPHASHHIANSAPGRDIITAVPDGLEPKAAAFARIASVATTALWLAEPHLQVGDTVAVVGLGIVGNLAAQLFQLAGASVIGIDVNAGRRQVAELCGIERVLDGSPGLAETVAQATGGRGARFVVEATGVTDLIPAALRATADRGFCLLLGTPRQPLQESGPGHLLDVHRRGLHLVGAHESVYPRHAPEGGRGMDTRSRWLLELIERERLRVEPMMTHVVTPQDAPAAYAGLADDPEKYMAVLIDWTATVAESVA